MFVARFLSGHAFSQSLYGAISEMFERRGDQLDEGERELSVSSEKLWGRDAVDVALNPSGDRETFLQIIADAKGAFDQFSHRAGGAKFRWDGVRVATGRREGGWTVEIAVPLNSPLASA